ncbi:chloride channel CLIC-like protein 1 [Clarias gariepinus]|uniref:chloride channel CLIC-like protein 1 n=1 Tax=Clarias gariepinus TaxID=13013 RepID=UPI00234CE1E7|nr:chloride channel CLIC-like protein 1 [Clarias gariepinus]
MITRRLGVVFVWGCYGLLFISSFSMLVYRNLHSEADESKKAPDSCQVDQCADMEKRTDKKELVNDKSTWTSGAQDDALGRTPIKIKLHDLKSRTWRLEDTFGVDLDTVNKVLVMAITIVVIICIEGWSKVSWFVQFWRMFAVCFLISLVWNWLYLYKTALAEHQAKMLKWENMMDKCTGGQKNGWWDDFKDWYRTTWTLQDDPCKEYFELLTVHPILQVPPTKVITVTLTTLFTDPLIHIGQGISAFLRALLKDLPITLQIPLLILFVPFSLVFLYGVGRAVVLLHWSQQGRYQDPPPAVADQPDAPPNRLNRVKEWTSVKTLRMRNAFTAWMRQTLGSSYHRKVHTNNI